MPKIFPHMIFRQCFNRTHDLIFWPLSFINKLATINRYNDEFRSDTFPYTPSILPTWRVAEWWIYTCPTDDLLPYRKSYADVGQVWKRKYLNIVFWGEKIYLNIFSPPYFGGRKYIWIYFHHYILLGENIFKYIFTTIFLGKRIYLNTFSPPYFRGRKYFLSIFSPNKIRCTNSKVSTLNSRIIKHTVREPEVVPPPPPPPPRVIYSLLGESSTAHLSTAVNLLLTVKVISTPWLASIPGWIHLVFCILLALLLCLLSL